MLILMPIAMPIIVLQLLLYAVGIRTGILRSGAMQIIQNEFQIYIYSLYIYISVNVKYLYCKVWHSKVHAQNHISSKKEYKQTRKILTYAVTHVNFPSDNINGAHTHCHAPRKL